MTEHTSSPDTTVTVDLGPWATDVDAYAARHQMSRDAAVLALVREALTRPHRNIVSGAGSGTIIQAGDVHRDVQF